MTATLVQPLSAKPLDILGDIHGEIDALRALLQHLGYAADGTHPEDRRLVFVGDLVDRGPDSPAVIALVQQLVGRQRAQCVLGNHELNILIGNHKPDNVWFFHQQLKPGDPAATRPQVWIQDWQRQQILDFFAGLPLALERPDLRIIHACWDEAMVAEARRATHVVAFHGEFKQRIEEVIRRRGLQSPFDKLARQNENPVKCLTSGLEAKAEQPFEAMGKLRYERRVAWWQDYDGPMCVFGHYWRIQLPGECDEQLFDGLSLNAALGRGNAMCIDYSVGKRFMERASPGFKGTFRTRLAALRWPERILVFDSGEEMSLIPPPRSGS